ncbi:hypothetical protein [Stigmatella aurantiaca]|uniref:hypothetical protein n=1 Tax=Stigmatella aurantiaca TaxID=41 RepID=UPI000565FED4|nr:hypothetical protein [Stigmatella aurantiaca]
MQNAFRLQSFVASLALLGLVGCAHVDMVSANLKSQAPYGVVQMGPSIVYIVDPRTETCVIVYGDSAAAQVSCAKLKKNVPEAARYVTWDPGAEDAPTPAPR